jgi:hypothetical protein
MGISRRLHLETVSEKFEMAAAKTGYTYISAFMQDSREIPTATPCLRGRRTQWRYQQESMSKHRSEIFKMATAKPEVHVSQLLYKIAKKFQRLSACFSGRASQWCYREDFVSKPEVRKSRWQHFIDEFTMHAIRNEECNIY